MPTPWGERRTEIRARAAEAMVAFGLSAQFPGTFLGLT